MTKVFKNGRQYIETEDGVYRVELPKIKGRFLTVVELRDEWPATEIAIFPEDITDFINMLLEAKSEYRKEFGYE